MFSLVFYISLLLTAVSFIPALGWISDVVSHFRMQYLFIQAFFGLFFLMNRNWLYFAITILFVALNIYVIKPYYTTKPNKVYQYRLERAKFRILQVNLDILPTEQDKVVKLIYEAAPEILILFELKEERLRALSQVLNQYLTKEYVLRKDDFGIGFFTSLPVERTEFKTYGQNDIPTLIASLKINGEPLNIVAVHATSPMDQEKFNSRNEQLRAIMNDRETFGENLVVVGDLGTSNWSSIFAEMLKSMRLRDSRLGFGIQPTWPAQIPFLLTPIDHCLVDESIAVLDRRVGPAVGSNHYPVAVQLGIYR